METEVTLTPVTLPEGSATSSSLGSGGCGQLPKQLEAVKAADILPQFRHRWNTNEEIAGILLAFSSHSQWQHHEVRLRPPSGCLLLFNRNSVRYRKDGYCWKKRKDGRTIREDHMKLKVQGLECIYGSYVHSAILPTFHRRCYWLLQNPDIVLVHYLNVPYPSNTKLSIPVLSIAMEKKEWTKEELTQQLKPMFSSSEQEHVSVLDETMETLVQRLMDNQDKLGGEHPIEGLTTTQKKRNVHIQPVSHRADSQSSSAALQQNCSDRSSCQLSMGGNHFPPQKSVNYAQSVIVNLSNLPNGQQVMLVTGQTNPNQLSLLQTHSLCPNSSNLSQGVSSTPCSSISSPLSGFQSSMSRDAAAAIMMNHYVAQGNSGPCLSRSASLCDPHHLQYDQSAIQRSQSDEAHINAADSKNNCMYGNNNYQYLQDMTAMFQSYQNASFSNGFHQPPLPVSQGSCLPGNLTDSLSQSHEQSCDSSLYQSSSYLSNECSTSIVNSFIEELMSSETNPSDGNKKSFRHLGDSFESIQPSLSTIQGSELNLDQLDLMDMPDLDHMCHEMALNASSPMEEQRKVSMCSPQTTSRGTSPHLKPKQDCANVSVSSSGHHCTTLSSNSETLNVFAQSSLASSNPGTSVSRVSTMTATVTDINMACGQCGCDVQSSRSTHVEGQGQPCKSSSCRQDSVSSVVHTTKTPNTIATITDFSPEWSYTEGQTKLLVTGPWHSNMGTYTVLMDGRVVATTLVQPGVLRCFVPGHKPGPVTLQVSCDGTVISNNAMFEYRPLPVTQPAGNQSETKSDWFSVEDSKLFECFVGKLVKLEAALSKVPDAVSVSQLLGSMPSVEQQDPCLSQHIASLSARLWIDNNATPDSGYMGLGLLHLAAALGLTQCIQALIAWRNESSNWMLEYEVDANSGDLNTCTPLMWACAKGHSKAAIILNNWNKGPLLTFNREGYLPLLVARQRGHHLLADQLEGSTASGDQSRSTQEVMTSPAKSRSHDQFSGSEPEILFSTSGVTDFDTSENPGEMCSNLQTVSIESSIDSRCFSTDPDFPNATSTPITDNVSCSTSRYLGDSQHQILENSSVLGELHIQIPLEDRNTNKKSQSIEISTNFSKVQNPKTVMRTPTSHKMHSKSMSASEKRQKLQKRFSVDVISNQTLEPVHFSPSEAFQRPVREANSEPHLAAGNLEHFMCQSNPMLSEGRDLGSPDMLVKLDHCDRHGHKCLQLGDGPSGQVTMDTDNVSEDCNSSDIDVERVSSDDEDIRRRMLAEGDDIENNQSQMVHLAKQIIAAMPERIKSSPSRCDESLAEEFKRERSSSYSSIHSASPHAASSFGEALSSYGEDSGISTPMHDSLAFEEYRYPDVYSDLGTPASSLSPDSTCLHSPYSPYTFHLDSPPPTAAEFIEYFNAPATFMEKDFSQLTLSDREQRKLYEAAKVIQSAYRQYRDKQCKQQAKEREAAVLIQSYYRRYKQYAYYKKMTQAAVLIQSQFRSYYAQKRFKKSRDAAVVIQNQYRSYKEHERLKKGGNKSVTQRFRSHYQRKPIVAGKGARVVQIVPDTDGSGTSLYSTNT
ncbi:calmodulin-binding transcription activator 1-like isoform X3 [Dreissena polymorpha]|uniref:calmodulin-binding transcription activator 1-like isoform X3 n=1 Tax=Dreissena polymorpha TaxID=45954 RepID=UPI00226486D0|nr:calmodulin-binding transcription activator 1-like isoform X3 [Dreissena polymorpha]